MNKIARWAGVLGSAVLLAPPSLAVQTVIPAKDASGGTFAANGANSWAVSLGAGQTLVFYGRYQSDADTLGLGLEVAYDETRFANVTIDQVLNKCLIALPQLRNFGIGDSAALLAWADISIRAGGVPGWPGTADPAAPTAPGAATGGCLDIGSFGGTPPQTTVAVALPTNLFRFSATLAPSFTNGSSTIVLAARSASSAFAEQTLVVTGGAALPPSLVQAYSRKVHGSAGTFDLPLSAVSTAPTTEPRSGGAGGSHTIVFTFDKPVNGGSAAVLAGPGVAGAISYSGNEMIVPVTAVTNQQYATVAVSGVTATDGTSGGSGSVRVGFLLGDVSQNRVVTVSDLAQVNAQIAQVVTASNYLKDVNASGTLTVADKGIANTQITKALPTP
jgi:hypothetical protein